MDRGAESERDGGGSRGSVAVRRLEFSVDWPPWHAAAFLVEGPTDEPVLVDAGVPDATGEEELREAREESSCAETFRWVSSTPFGRPVVPEV